MNNNHPTWSLDPKALIEGQGEGAALLAPRAPDLGSSLRAFRTRIPGNKKPAVPKGRGAAGFLLLTGQHQGCWRKKRSAERG
jgi:hypothetical protein